VEKMMIMVMGLTQARTGKSSSSRVEQQLVASVLTASRCQQAQLDVPNARELTQKRRDATAGGWLTGESRS
jgi:hypothetical protein